MGFIVVLIIKILTIGSRRRGAGLISPMLFFCGSSSCSQG